MCLGTGCLCTHEEVLCLFLKGLSTCIERYCLAQEETVFLLGAEAVPDLEDLAALLKVDAEDTDASDAA